MNTEAGNKLSFKGQIVMTSGIKDGYITIENGYIIDVGELPLSNHIIDLEKKYIVPGFIDLHIHGIHSYLIDNGPEDFREICRVLPRYGVTSFLPTVAPRPKGEDVKFLDRLARTVTEGSNILGFHLEGPFLKISGSLTSEAVSGADTSRVEALIKAVKPFRTIFSISPDVQGIENLIPLMARDNTPVFITHTAANVEQTRRAIELGARHATHFYDVFPCPSVADPGVRPCGAVEAILADDRVSVDFILDGVHVDPIAIKMALVSKRQGPGTVCLITDANVGAGLGTGRFVFGGSGEIEFAYKGAPARLVKDNTLAGSGLTMDQALRNAVKFLDLSLPEAVSLLSANPAKVLGLEKSKGSLQPGYDADFTVLNDELEIEQTWINGKCYFEK
jgi:N-acetylglucosamine-6-phosphate deacetylase